MKKICFFIASIAKAGGTERVCTEVANKLSQLGYEVTIISFYGSTSFFKLHPDIKIISLYNRKYNFKLFFPFVINRLRKRIIQVKPDILISVDSALFMYALLSTLNLKLKNIVWEHFSFNESLGAKVRIVSRKLAVKYANAVVVLTKKDKSNWKENLNCKASVFTINNPTPFNNVIYSDEDRKNIVLSVGRLDPIKGFDRLLDAWKLVKTTVDSDWELNIVGSGKVKDELVVQIGRLNLTGSVKLIPQTTEIQKHYKTASIYCLTSRSEGFPVVLLEAQSFGLPLVSFDCEIGPSEIISNGENGVLVKNGDITDLANKLIYYVNNKDIRLKAGKKSFESSEKYSTDAIIKSWVQLFDKL